MYLMSLRTGRRRQGLLSRQSENPSSGGTSTFYETPGLTLDPPTRSQERKSKQVEYTRETRISKRERVGLNRIDSKPLNYRPKRNLS